MGKQCAVQLGMLRTDTVGLLRLFYTGIRLLVEGRVLLDASLCAG